jgi:SAM-dependent methyltransferase
MTAHFEPQQTHLRSIKKYEAKAKFYDSTLGPTNQIRLRCIDNLKLQLGDVVLDVGCGSGASFEYLLEKIGPSGFIYGFDQSAQMLEMAQKKIKQNQWKNVHLQHGFAESVTFEKPINALLFHYTHDILQSPRAVNNLLSHALPNARVAIAGMKNFPIWTGPLVLLSFFKNYAWNGNPSGLGRPWRHIASELNDWNQKSMQWGMGYIASGTKK